MIHIFLPVRQEGGKNTNSISQQIAQSVPMDRMERTTRLFSTHKMSLRDMQAFIIYCL
jgi:hypothetical protein